ncbi:glyceraldehyde-3-phosphate dehydrogenase, type I [Edhazardia aedis USNM 41457]|uniref:Glyceraldehyde-3-phosphate dehydrogenase n=1 Tax=Edhazardia aedis (strain USNM 41457) TaxID=1003232 RepID=J9D3G4_EDHAE|nr:glyceraldehyde-3-phosphate dehydrogenase, type I [Edhazardia aedis USNM 41457]|eukprot:EJW02386.1 glyceraldehyde-3-phosphate dehydrogenase, type I [Edhazardia aedis USNM 41457]
MKVGINGFGRIGKTIYKILHERNVKVPQINDPFLSPEYLAYSLKYDSTFGSSKEKIEAKDNKIIYGNTESTVYAIREPENIPWDVDVVIEASGVFTTKDQCAKHKCDKVLITAPSKDAPMFVYGVNHTQYNNEKVFSNASCTTNCLAPLAKILNDNFGIVEGLMTTVHACTATQKIVDAVSAKDWRSGRGGMQNIIPASTGAAKAVAKVIPSLDGKLTGMAFRVPVANVSVVDFTFRTNKPTNLADIQSKIEDASKSSMNGVISVVKEPVVSSDFNGCSLSSIVDITASIALNNNFFKIVSWYDNEYGYSCRVVDLIEYICGKK